MTIDANRITEILKDALFLPEELVDGNPPSDATIVEGIVRRFGLHRLRLESHREEVKRILFEELPEEFQVDKGGGWSFLAMCNDRTGIQWGEHSNMEELCVLAIGLDLAKFIMPRSMWSMFPGGMPYIVFEDKTEASAT